MKKYMIGWIFAKAHPEVRDHHSSIAISVTKEGVATINIQQVPLNGSIRTAELTLSPTELNSFAYLLHVARDTNAREGHIAAQEANQ